MYNYKNKWVYKPRNKYNFVVLKIKEGKENLQQGPGWLGLLEIRNCWQKKHLALSRQLEKKEIVNLFMIIMYLQNIVSIHPISYYEGCCKKLSWSSGIK